MNFFCSFLSLFGLRYWRKWSFLPPLNEIPSFYSIVLGLTLRFLRTHLTIDLFYLFFFKTLESSTKLLFLFYPVMSFYLCADYTNCIIILTLVFISPLDISTTDWPQHPPWGHSSSSLICFMVLFITLTYFLLVFTYILYVSWVNKILLVHYVTWQCDMNWW